MCFVITIFQNRQHSTIALNMFYGFAWGHLFLSPSPLAKMYRLIMHRLAVSSAQCFVRFDILGVSFLGSFEDWGGTKLWVCAKYMLEISFMEVNLCFKTLTNHHLKIHYRKFKSGLWWLPLAKLLYVVTSTDINARNRILL